MEEWKMFHPQLLIYMETVTSTLQYWEYYTQHKYILDMDQFVLTIYI